VYPPPPVTAMGPSAARYFSLIGEGSGPSLPPPALRTVRVTSGRPGRHPEKFAPVGPRTCHLLAVDIPAGASGGAKLLKLGVERLAVGADAGISKGAVLHVSFGGIFRRT
jgi:hypothetical protein